MAVQTGGFQVKTRGETHIIDITRQVADAVGRSGISEGLAAVFVAGSTAGITTIEHESGLVSDLREAFERVAPRDGVYAHNERWGDGNGYAHIRASFIGQTRCFPVRDGEPVLGTWQQLILIDFDNRPRTRTVTVQIIS
ncbi:MAG: secondary thiamine-phosphate synthase enzyme YjbQ [Spirochaetota bacterium]